MSVKEAQCSEARMAVSAIQISSMRARSEKPDQVQFEAGNIQKLQDVREALVKANVTPPDRLGIKDVEDAKKTAPPVREERPGSRQNAIGQSVTVP
jgi:hypothetical protein